MLRVALTGGIGTGKSHVLDRLAARGVPTIDADRLARDVVEPGRPAWRAIVDRFGPSVLQGDRRLNRRALAALVFDDPAARLELEDLTHPAIFDALETWFAGLPGGTAYAVAAVPLLYETGRDSGFDFVVATVCPEAAQIARVRQRDGVPEDDVRRRIAAQIPAAEKARRADFVIDTAGSFEETDRQVDELVRRLGAEAEKIPEAENPG